MLTPKKIKRHDCLKYRLRLGAQIFASRFRMCIVVCGLQSWCRQVSIQMCGRKRLMAEQFLNASQIGSVVEHMNSEGVPECTRRDAGI